MKFRSLLLLSTLAAPLTASALSFDFESVANGQYAGSLSVTNGGVTATITPDVAVAGPLIVVDNPLVGILGSHSSAAFHDPAAFGNNVGENWAFSAEITDITFAYGDAGGDDDGFVTIVAFDQNNVLLGNFSKFYGTSDAGDTISFHIPGMRSFTCDSQGQAPGSLWFEVQSATAVVPEPATTVALLAGLAAVLKKRRRA